MKKILNVYNITLMLVLVIVGVLTIKTMEVKAAGTVSWSGPSSITIRSTINEAMNPMDVSLTYVIEADSDNPSGASGAPTDITVAFTRTSPTVSNYTLTKTAVLSFSNMTFTKPGNYTYNVIFGTDDIGDVGGDHYLYVAPEFTANYSQYKVVISVRNIVDSNNNPTGNYTASLILQECNSGQSPNPLNCSKIDQESGVLYADYDYTTTNMSMGAITKTVKGIGADTTEYFPFTISIDDEDGTFDGWVFPVTIYEDIYSNNPTDVTNISVNYNGQTRTQPTSITSGGSSITLYLKHNQIAVIGAVINENNPGEALMGIPGGASCGDDSDTTSGQSNHINKKFELKNLIQAPDTSSKNKVIQLGHSTLCGGDKWSVQEEQGDYTPSYAFINGGSSEESEGNSFSDVRFPHNNTSQVTFTNTKEMSPVTGLIFTILPYLILAGIGIGGTLLFIHLKKEKKTSQ
ncbi:MAG: hypothetical protein IJH18_00170 [Bacilli bacterium]|nr:hypothetical protein [Bacilli bacterium]